MMSKAKEILEAAQNRDDGSITIMPLRAGTLIHAGGKNLSVDTEREAAELRAALDELEASGYIEPASESSYRLTHEGWNYKF